MLGKSVRELHESMDSAEISEWLAFDRAYNLPDAHYLAATIGQAIFRSWSGKAPALEYFAPILKGPDDDREQTPEEAMALFRGMTERLGRG